MVVLQFQKRSIFYTSPPKRIIETHGLTTFPAAVESVRVGLAVNGLQTRATYGPGSGWLQEPDPAKLVQQVERVIYIDPGEKQLKAVKRE